MDCKNILIVEDDIAIMQTMKDVLEINGYQVFTAANGEEGLETLKTISPLPCLILLDLMMPKVNGWEFLSMLRNFPKFAKIPVAICSAYKESAKAIRPDAFLEKPLQYSELTETIRRFCA